jgi:hypothetical protein
MTRTNINGPFMAGLFIPGVRSFRHRPKVKMLTPTFGFNLIIDLGP